MNTMEVTDNIPNPEVIVLKQIDSFPVPKVKKTKEGYLRGEAVVSRIGVFEYADANGTIRRELRHPDEVFKPASLEAFKMIPITDDHPNEFVDASNSALYQKGYSGESVRRDGDGVVVTKTITHKDVIDKVLRNEKCELSVGYEVTLIKKSGVYEPTGERYDYIQTNIIPNHIAIVERGRAGRTARLRFDAAQHNFNQKEKKMSKDDEVLDTKNLDKEIETKSLRIDALNAENQLLQNQVEQLTAKVERIDKAWDKTKKELEAEKASRLDSVIDQKVSDRVNLFVHALPYLKDDLDGYMKHSDREIMEKVMNSTRNDALDFTGKSDEYVAGRFDSFIGANLKTARADTKSMFHLLSKKCDTSSEMTIGDRLMKQLQNKGN